MMMRRFIANIISSTIVMGILIGIMCLAGYVESTYSMQGTVLSHKGNIWYIEDSRGEVWEYESIALADGEEVKIIFFDNHTHRLYDDEIVKIKPVKNHK